MLLVLPVAAFAGFAPGAWSALAASPRTPHRAAGAELAAVPPSGIAVDADLRDWTDTVTTTTAQAEIREFLSEEKVIARRLSSILNGSIRNLTNLRNAAPPNSLTAQLAQQALNVYIQENSDFRALYKILGAKGHNNVANTTAIFAAAGTIVSNAAALTAFQIQETVTGSVTTFSPIGF
jgi:hypothetical protein